MNDEEFELIRNCVRTWHRQYDRMSDEEYYGIAWEYLEKARRKFDGRGNWIKFARQRVIFGLMSEYRSIHRRVKGISFCAYNPELDGREDKTIFVVDYLDEIEHKAQSEIFMRFRDWRKDHAL